jgi:ubiquinone/menaquinone biosynthesis C-methylase UbiE
MLDKKMSDKWKKIWSLKKQIEGGIISLESLIKADGFDTGAGSYTSDGWKMMVTDFCNRVEIKDTYNIIEIGCGSGAFIYAANDICRANWYGIDYSESLINLAKDAIPNGTFVVDEAINLNFEETLFDVVFSHSVFHYFPDKDYAKDVLRAWCSKLKKNGYLVLLDINDIEKLEIYHSQRAKEHGSPEEYEKKYSGLSHLFFEKNELFEFLTNVGMAQLKFFPHKVSDYGNAKFRFNLICKKR